MIELLNRYILYTFNDSAIGFYSNTLRYLRLQKYIEGTDYEIFSHNLIDLIPTFFITFLSRFVPFIFLNNIVLITAFLLNLYFSNKLFKLLTKNTWISLILSLFNATSIYFYFRVISATPALYFTFVIPLTLYFLINKSSILKVILSCVLAFLFSGYYGFFCFTLVGLWLVSEILVDSKLLKQNLQKIGIFTGITFLSILMLFPNLVLNHLFFNNKSNIKEGPSKDTVIARPIEDWYSFSFRPWYFVIPPKDSYFFGSLSKALYTKISSTGYYLNDDYNDQEMAGSYLGWHFILSWILSLGIIWYSKKNSKIRSLFQNVNDNYKLIIVSTLVVAFIVLLNGPPSITISGIKMYTPSYLLFLIVPFFRTIVRWSSVIYLLVLVINSFVIIDLYKMFKSRVSRVIFLSSFVLLTSFLMAIKIAIIDTKQAPLAVKKIEELTQRKDKVAVFPTANYDNIFWLSSKERFLVNPRDLQKGSDNIATGYFINIIKDKTYLESQGVSYLMYYQNDVSQKTIKRMEKVDPTLQTKEQVKSLLDTFYGNPIANPESDVFIYKIRGNK